MPSQFGMCFTLVHVFIRIRCISSARELCASSGNCVGELGPTGCWTGGAGRRLQPHLQGALIPSGTSSPACLLSFWNSPLDAGSGMLLQPATCVSGHVASSASLPLSDTICIRPDFSPLKVLIPSGLIPCPQGRSVTVILGLHLRPQLWHTRLDTTGCCPADWPLTLTGNAATWRCHERLEGAHPSLGKDWVPQAVSLSPTTNSGGRVGLPLVAMTSSRTGVSLGLRCLEPGCWAFAMVEKAGQEKCSRGQQEAEEMPSAQEQRPGVRPRTCRKLCLRAGLGRCAW